MTNNIEAVEMELTEDEARLMIRAALSGIKGFSPIEHNPVIARSLVTKIAYLCADMAECTVN